MDDDFDSNDIDYTEELLRGFFTQVFGEDYDKEKPRQIEKQFIAREPIRLGEILTIIDTETRDGESIPVVAPSSPENPKSVVGIAISPDRMLVSGALNMQRHLLSWREKVWRRIRHKPKNYWFDG